MNRRGRWTGGVVGLVALVALVVVTASASEVARAGVVLTVCVLPLGYALHLVAMPRRGVTGLAGLATAAALGLANGSLVALALNAVGVGITAGTWSAALAAEFALLVLVISASSRTRSVVRRWRWERAVRAAVYPITVILGGLSIAAVVAVTYAALPSPAGPTLSTQFSLADASAATSALRSAAPGTTIQVPVIVDRAPGDGGEYEVRVAVGGWPDQVVSTIQPSSPNPLLVFVPVPVPSSAAGAGPCRYRAQITLSAPNREAPSYDLALFGGPPTGSDCTSGAAA